MDLRDNLQWYWDLSSADASIVDQHNGLSLGRIGTTTTSATGGPDGGPCINFGAAAGKYRNASVAKIVSYDDGFTVNIWVRSTGTGGAGNWLINHRGDGGVSRYLQLIARNPFDGGTDRSIIWDEALSIRRAFSARESENVWQMLTMVDDGNNNLSIFRNAVLLDVNTTTETFGDRATGNAPFAIGGHAWSAGIGSLEHQGQLAMAGVWNGPLTQSQITALFNDNKGRRYGDLVIATGNPTANLHNTIRSMRHAL